MVLNYKNCIVQMGEKKYTQKTKFTLCMMHNYCFSLRDSKSYNYLSSLSFSIQH